MKLRKMLGMTILLSSLFMTPSYAESKEGMLNFTVGYGYNFFPSKRHLDDTGMGLLALGYNFTDNLGIEGLLGIYNTKSNSTEGNGRSVHGKLFLLDGVYHFWPAKNFEPYVMLGFGVLGLSYNNNNANNQGNINGGIGIQYFFSKRVTFRLEGRDIYTITGGINDTMLAAGLNFLFYAG